MSGHREDCTRNLYHYTVDCRVLYSHSILLVNPERESPQNFPAEVLSVPVHGPHSTPNQHGQVNVRHLWAEMTPTGGHFAVVGRFTSPHQIVSLRLLHSVPCNSIIQLPVLTSQTLRYTDSRRIHSRIRVCDTARCYDNTCHKYVCIACDRYVTTSHKDCKTTLARGQITQPRF